MGWMPFERKGDYDDPDYSRGHRVRRACAALCLLLVILLILLGLAALITYLILRPRAARTSITSASVTILTAPTTSTITAQILYGVELRNPNTRVTLEYDSLHLQTTYLGVDIGHSGFALRRLRVPRRSTFVVSAGTSAAGVAVSDIVGDALQRDIASGSVVVRTKIDVRLRAHVGSYTSFWVWVDSVCDVAVSPPNGAVAGMLQRANCDNT